jgi:hypothetical protein
MQDTTTWATKQLAELETKGQILTESEKKTYHIEVLINIINKVPNKIVEATELDRFKANIESLLTLFPVKTEKNKFVDKAYLKAVNELKIESQKKYNLVVKGYYIAIFLPLGVAIGLPFGLMFKNIALGLPIGLCIGIAIGTALDQKAQKEGRII